LPLMKEQTNRIPSLDGLRATAVSLVLFSHLIGTHNFLNAPKSSFLNELANLGVKLFFVISGYLITNLLLHELQRTNRIHLGKFYFRRTFRIFAPFYFMLGGLILLRGIGWIGLTSRDVLSAVTYTSNYYHGRSWSIGHTWSLAVEEQFYLVWPAALALLGWRKGFKAAAAVVLACPIVRYVLWHFYGFDGIGHRFETVADAIATGCLLAGARNWLKAQSSYRRILASPFFVIVPLTVLAANSFASHPTVFYLISHTVMNIGIALCVDWSVTYCSGSVGRILNSRPLVFVGLASYSLYLWQQLFLDRHSASWMTRFPLNIALVAAAGIASYYIVEQPSLRLRQRLEQRIFSSHKPAPAAASEKVQPVSGYETAFGEPVA
jgi:peptidoglycan/LPS O-acetylase OafA/YrhL